MTTETLYWNPLSPNGRLVYFFALEAKIKLETKPLNFATGDHKKPEYLAINPNGQVPGLTDGDLNLFESSSIIRYLAVKHKSSLYPVDNYRALGPIDVAYQHIRSTLWDSHGQYFFQTFIKPNFLKLPLDTAKITEVTAALEQHFTFIEKHFFKESSFVVGKSISIADIALATALTQLSVCKYEVNAVHDKITAHFKAMKELESYKNAHAPLWQMLQAIAAQAAGGDHK